jgi:alkanesulfonate monooxygenase SsuD/methylene tetrahydromethanopterin reductase-like flavin-dependent oxidoreductase (luciferase family)
MAGRITVRLGTMVIVLPWHDPLRVAEEVSLLENLSNGRMILGIGRGLGADEFEGFRVDMNESRQRFKESAETVLDGLERGYVEYDGNFVKQPRRDIRPAPVRTFRGRTFGAATSADSMPIMAKLGAGLLVIPQKRWDETAKDVDYHKTCWQEVRPGTQPPKPLLVAFFIVDHDAGRAREMAERYLGRYYDSVMRHYGFSNAEFGKAKGYEQYSALAQSAQADKAKLTRKFVNLSPCGTPAQVLEKLSEIRGYIDMKAVIGHFAFAGIPYGDVEKSMRLFASEVMPTLKSWETEALDLTQPAASRDAA